MSNNITGLGEAYRRHIVIDNIHKVVYIEVQASLKGHPKQHEWEDIAENNLWHKYLPTEIIPQIREIVTNGYKVQPMVNFGASSEAFYVIQMSEIHKKETIKTFQA